MVTCYIVKLYCKQF